MPWCISVVTKLIIVLSLPPPRAGAGKDAADLADQPTLDPESTSLVQEVPHLRRHVAEAGGGAKDDGIVIAQFLGRSNGRGLVELRASLLGHIGRHGFRHTLEGDFDARNRACAFGNRVGHCFDVAVGGIVEDKEFGHGAFILQERPQVQRQGRANRPICKR
jgi:hypothetical protein